MQDANACFLEDSPAFLKVIVKFCRGLLWFWCFLLCCAWIGEVTRTADTQVHLQQIGNQHRLKKPGLHATCCQVSSKRCGTWLLLVASRSLLSVNFVSYLETLLSLCSTSSVTCSPNYQLSAPLQPAPSPWAQPSHTRHLQWWPPLQDLSCLTEFCYTLHLHISFVVVSVNLPAPLLLPRITQC